MIVRKLTDRILDATSEALINSYETRLQELEYKKVELSEILEISKKGQTTSNTLSRYAKFISY